MAKAKASKKVVKKPVVKKAVVSNKKKVVKKEAPKKKLDKKPAKKVVAKQKVEKKPAPKKEVAKKKETVKSPIVAKVKAKAAVKETKVSAKDKVKSKSKVEELEIDEDEKKPITDFEDDDDFDFGIDPDSEFSFEEELEIQEDIRHDLIEEVSALAEDFNVEEVFSALRDINFFSKQDTDDCREKICDNLSSMDGYCRLHYIKNWKSIKRKRIILKEGKLVALVEELIRKYPANLIELVANDLMDDKQFFQALKAMNIETTIDYDDTETYGDLEDDDDTDINVETRGFSGGKALDDDDFV